MMQAEVAFDHIQQCGIMAGMRGNFPPENALPVCEALLAAGIRVFEFTYNSIQPVEAMVAVKAEFGDAVCVGMGTVLSTTVARRVIDEGADFVVSPAFQPDVVQTVLDAGLLVAPGVFTPSEIVAAWNMDVKLVKLYPIGTVGIDHFKQLRGPLDQVNFLCNGGMNHTNVGDFIKAGAIACGLGSWLTGDGTASLDTIRKRARLLRDIVDAARENRPLPQRA
jgi:2-dehydro-3-deoxyphosphogluconate aldolase/(4S)-4-hydroxy-2-oxoglutarate aldolase